MWPQITIDSNSDEKETLIIETPNQSSVHEEMKCMNLPGHEHSVHEEMKCMNLPGHEHSVHEEMKCMNLPGHEPSAYSREFRSYLHPTKNTVGIR